jgi:hypothetical protein
MSKTKSIERKLKSLQDLKSFASKLKKSDSKKALIENLDIQIKGYKSNEHSLVVRMTKTEALEYMEWKNQKHKEQIKAEKQAAKNKQNEN